MDFADFLRPGFILMEQVRAPMWASTVISRLHVC